MGKDDKPSESGDAESERYAAIRTGSRGTNSGRVRIAASSPWVELDEREQIKPEELKRLEDLLEKYAGQIEWGTPAERAALKSLCNIAKTCLHTEDDVRRFREENAGSIPMLREESPRASGNPLGADRRHRPAVTDLPTTQHKKECPSTTVWVVETLGGPAAINQTPWIVTANDGDQLFITQLTQFRCLQAPYAPSGPTWGE